MRSLLQHRESIVVAARWAFLVGSVLSVTIGFFVALALDLSR